MKPTFYCVWKKARYFAEPMWKKSLERPFSAENAILETQNSLENLISWHKTYSNSFESSHLSLNILCHRNNITCYHVATKLSLFWRKEAKVYTGLKWKCPALESLLVYIVILLNRKKIIIFNRWKTVLPLFLILRNKQEQKLFYHWHFVDWLVRLSQSFKTININNGVLLR